MVPNEEEESLEKALGEECTPRARAAIFSPTTPQAVADQRHNDFEANSVHY